MATFRLRIGFPESVPPTEAMAVAIADWRAACERAGYSVEGEPSVLLITDDPERAAVGEYTVDVVGERVKRGDDGDV